MLRYITGLVVVMFLAVPAFAQNETATGKIRGTITDRETNTPIHYVTVRIEGLSLTDQSDENGTYEIENVPAGIYNISFSMIGYRSIVRTNVSASPNRTTELSVRLEPEAIMMDAITVEAEPYYFEKDPEAEVSGKTMDKEEIMNIAGGTMDIQRLVQVLPAVVSGSDQMNEIIVRGGNYGENLFVMDGIEIPNPNHFASQGIGGGPISLLRTEFIQDVSFMAGAFPARYGDKASSVMDISLRRGARDRMMTNLDMGMAGLGLMAEGPLGNDGSYLLSARKSYLDLIIMKTGLTAVPKYYNLQSKLTFNLRDRHTLMWNSVYANDTIEIRGEEEDIGYNQGAENVDSGGDQIITGLTLKSLWSKNIYSEGVLSFVSNTYETDVWEEIENTINPQFSNESVEQETNLKYDITWQMSTTELSGGFSLKNCHFDHNLLAEIDTVYIYTDTLHADPRDDGIPTTYDILKTSNEKWHDEKTANTLKSALYGQVRLTPFERLNLRIGGRYEHLEYTNKGHFAPRIGLHCRLGHDFWLNGAYGIHYQSPAYITLTAHEANKNLDYYHTEQSVIGIEWYPWSDTRLTLEGYKKNYVHVPVDSSWVSGDPWYSSHGRSVNKARGHSEGIEFFIQKKMSTSYMYLLSFSRYRAFFVDPRMGEERPWDFDHRNVFTAQAAKRWTLGKADWYQRMKTKLWYKICAWIIPFGDEVMLSAKWRFVGGRPYTEPTYYRMYHRWVVESTTPYNDNRLPDYHRLDIRLDRRFYFKGWSLIAYLDIMNIYGRKNIWDYSRDEYGEVDNVYQYQTMPIGGFNIEF